MSSVGRSTAPWQEAGAERVRFVELPVAVALGSGLRIEEPIASMVVDVGAGTTEIGVLALGGLVTQASVPVGGGDFDEAIKNLCSRQLDLVIDSATAENVKYEIGSAWVEDDDKVEVRGRDASNGIVRSVVIWTEVADAIAPRVDRILAHGGGVHLFSSTDLANDLLNHGLFLAGGGALPHRFRPADRDRHGDPGSPGRGAGTVRHLGGRVLLGLDEPHGRVRQSSSALTPRRSSAA